MRANVWEAVLLATSLAFAQADDPAREAQRAQELLAAGKAEEAIRIYQALVRNAPDNAALLLNLSIAEYTAKQYREAATHAAAALKLQPNLLPARLFLGGSQLQLGEVAAAIDELQAVAAANPRERNGQLMLGEALLEAGRPEPALEHLEIAAQLLPENPRVWYGIGRAQSALGREAAADKAWQRLMALPPSLETHLHAAEVASSKHRWREAAVEWREAVRLAPEKTAFRIRLAEALFRSRDYEGAMATLKPLLAGESADAQFLYGASLVNLQRPEEAIPYLRTAIGRDPKLPAARAALGQALLEIGKAEEAIPLLQGALSADEDGSTHFQLFRAYQLAHRDADAQHALAEYQRFRASLAPRF